MNKMARIILAYLALDEIFDVCRLSLRRFLRTCCYERKQERVLCFPTVSRPVNTVELRHIIIKDLFTFKGLILLSMLTVGPSCCLSNWVTRRTARVWSFIEDSAMRRI